MSKPLALSQVSDRIDKAYAARRGSALLISRHSKWAVSENRLLTLMGLEDTYVTGTN